MDFGYQTLPCTTRYNFKLDRHAEKILRDFLSPIDGDLQKTIYAELSGLTQDDAL
jgi:hypothetical protein